MSNAIVAGVCPCPIIHKNLLAILLATACIAAPAESHACACGCGVFDVGTADMLPEHPGGMAWLEYDFMNQGRNWHDGSGAPPENNDDKDLKSSFLTAGAQYMFNRSWGAEAEVPYTFRHFTTTNDSGDIASYDHSALGDIRIQGIYSGFSPDMSSGLTFGLKLPTGNFSQAGFDRDTAIGSGSTDVLIGGYHMGNVSGMWNWFADGRLDQPVLISAGYRPGSEVDAAAGVYYNGWRVGGVKIAPVAQLVESYRVHDSGLAANPGGSGYERVLLAPGVEIDQGGWHVYGDIGFPIYQHVRGDQLVAAELFKLNIGHSF